MCTVGVVECGAGGGGLWCVAPPSAAPAAGATGTDANVLQISRAGVAAGLVSIPNRYMHTQVEVVSLSDLDACAKVLAETIAKITSRTDFVPR